MLKSISGDLVVVQKSWLLYSARPASMLLSFHSLVLVEILTNLNKFYIKQKLLN